MNKCRILGYIEYNGTLKVNGSLLSFLLHGGSDEMAPTLETPAPELTGAGGGRRRPARGAR